MTYQISSIRSGLVSLSDGVHSIGRQGEAAVLVPIIRSRNKWSLLLTKRAMHMRHHGGEVAFPGGMWEEGDHFPVHTALREAEEEVALLPDQVHILGALPAMPTKSNVQVTPVVGLIDSELSLVANPEEIASIFYVPIEELLPDNRIRTDVFPQRENPLWAPAYDYDGYEIWGFTAGVIKILLERCFSVRFERTHPAPEKIW